jgi:hypothetical protein
MRNFAEALKKLDKSEAIFRADQAWKNRREPQRPAVDEPYRVPRNPGRAPRLEAPNPELPFSYAAKPVPDARPYHHRPVPLPARGVETYSLERAEWVRDLPMQPGIIARRNPGNTPPSKLKAGLPPLNYTSGIFRDFK